MEQNKEIRKLDDRALIDIIERQSKTEDLYKKSVREEIARRQLSPEQVMKLAIEVNKTIAYERLGQEELTNEEVTLHQSVFLNQEEVRQIYIEQLEQYMKDKDQFRFDVWSYAIGGM